MRPTSKSLRRRTHMQVCKMDLQPLIVNELGLEQDLVQVVTSCSGSASVICPTCGEIDLFTAEPKENYIPRSIRKNKTDPIADEISEMFNEYNFSEEEFDKIKGFRYNLRSTVEHLPREFKNTENPFETN